MAGGASRRPANVSRTAVEPILVAGKHCVERSRRDASQLPPRLRQLVAALMRDAVVDKIVIPPGDELLQVVGTWGRCWRPRPDRRWLTVRLSVMLVAGGGFEPPTFGL